jgi:microcystin-dependent protein
MPGTIPLSMTQQFDVYGQPLAGAKLYLIQAGTVSTPQNGFQDLDLTIPLPNPITLDAAGRIPQFFLDDGLIKILLQDVNGIVQLASDNILVIGPSSSGGGGGGGSVDPTTVYATGDLKPRYGTGTIAGFVRCNGLTIGQAASGASERANADCQSLFQYLWGADPNLVVSGGRGASPNADWLAAKQIILPDWRGRMLGFVDGMGAGATSRLTTAYWGAGVSNPLTLGAGGGAETHTLVTAEMPSHFHRADIYDPQHAHTGSTNAQYISTGGGPVQYFGGPQNIVTATISINANATGVRVNSSNGLDLTYSVGGDTPHSSASPSLLATMYIKL